MHRVVGESGSEALRVLIVDDHPLFRAGLRAALESADDIRVVAEVETVAAVAEAIVACRPDLVIMDLSLPDGSGIDATRRVVAETPSVPVLVLTMSDDDGSLLAALRAGAGGYLVKGAARDEVLHAVRSVAHGGAVFGAQTAGRLTAMLADGGGRRGEIRACPELTARECEVLDLLARGWDNRRIAQRLFLAEKTVRNHITHIFEKLHVDSRAGAVARARDLGLGAD